MAKDVATKDDVKNIVKEAMKDVADGFDSLGRGLTNVTVGLKKVVPSTASYGMKESHEVVSWFQQRSALVRRHEHLFANSTGMEMLLHTKSSLRELGITDESEISAILAELLVASRT